MIRIQFSNKVGVNFTPHVYGAFRVDKAIDYLIQQARLAKKLLVSGKFNVEKSHFIVDNFIIKPKGK